MVYHPAQFEEDLLNTLAFIIYKQYLDGHVAITLWLTVQHHGEGI